MNREALANFVDWAAAHITGDEKSQAQIFLDRLFQAFGQPGCLEVGGSPEVRVRKAAEDGGGTAFADYVWKPVVLIEMKRRGIDLQRHYRQAFDYWARLVPNRPRYVILCNFDEFRVYDFETQMDTPVDTVALADLPRRYGALAFLAPGNPRPTFGNDRVAVTRQAADKLAACFRHLAGRGVDRDLAQRFVLQTLVALFAEDIGLLEKYFVARLLADCGKAEDSFDLLGGLFAAMNSARPVTGGRYKGVPYFNGGLFAHSAAIELDIIELNLLREAAAFDWSKVQPEIFGTLFQDSLAAGQRHALGAHFTHPADIMKIVGPTIVEPWREQIEGARSLRRLRELSERLRQYRVLDPACGSGNFLYIAYRELKRLEARLFERMDEFRSEGQAGQGRLSFLSAQNFYGMDILPFAVEIAKVTMMIARKLAIDEMHITEKALPLDNLDANFVACDALLLPGGLPTPWPQVDVIIGNPPFLGSRFLAKEHGYDYARRLHEVYPDMPKMADYCVHWLRRAHEHLPPCTAADPVAGRAGLVGTQNIRNNQSRVGGLDQIVKDGTIVEAVDNQPWSGDANVHVSIVNWVKTQDVARLPKTRRLWHKVEEVAKSAKRRPGEGPAGKHFQLAVRECAHINSALSDSADACEAFVLWRGVGRKLCFVGQYPFNEGFLLDPSEAAEWLRDDPASRAVLFPYMIGRDLVEAGQPSRWIIDFGQSDMLTAAQYGKPFQRVKERVMPTVLDKAQAEKAATGKESTRWTRLAERWWQFRDYQPGTMRAIAGVPRYIVCSRVTKRPVFAFLSQHIHPDNTLMVFPLPDDYSFGILQSSAHWLWFTTKCSKLKSDFRYTPESVFDTFPWPQSASVRQIEAVAAAGCEVRNIRAAALPKIKGGLRALYRTLELPGKNPLKDAHAALDAAVLAAYGFDPKGDLLAQLLDLNLAVAGRLERGELVVAPGLPPGFPDPARLVTADCIQPPLVMDA